MNYTKKELTNKTSGLLVAFRSGKVDSPHAKVIREGTFRRKLEITLPETVRANGRVREVARIIAYVEDGFYWPIHLEWDNAMQFFTISQLEDLENRLKSISFYMHRTPKTFYLSSLDVDELERAMKKEQQRQRYGQRKQSAAGGDAS